MKAYLILIFYTYLGNRTKEPMKIAPNKETAIAYLKERLGKQHTEAAILEAIESGETLEPKFSWLGGNGAEISEEEVLDNVSL